MVINSLIDLVMIECDRGIPLELINKGSVLGNGLTAKYDLIQHNEHTNVPEHPIIALKPCIDVLDALTFTFI